MLPSLDGCTNYHTKRHIHSEHIRKPEPTADWCSQPLILICYPGLLPASTENRLSERTRAYAAGGLTSDTPERINFGGIGVRSHSNGFLKFIGKKTSNFTSVGMTLTVAVSAAETLSTGPGLNAVQVAVFRVVWVIWTVEVINRAGSRHQGVRKIVKQDPQRGIRQVVLGQRD